MIIQCAFVKMQLCPKTLPLGAGRGLMEEVTLELNREGQRDGEDILGRSNNFCKNAPQISEKGTSFGNFGRDFEWYLFMSLYKMNYNN